MKKVHVALSLIILTLATLAVPGAVCAAKPAPTGTPEALHQRLEALDQDLQAHLRRIANQAVDGEATDPDLLEKAEGFRQRIEALERTAREQAAAEHGAGSSEETVWLKKIRQLRHLLANLETAGRKGASSAVLPGHDRRPVTRVPLAKSLAVPANDDCADARTVDFGTYGGNTSRATHDDAMESCGASIFSPDVWFKYTATDYREVSIDTFGSAYDTVLSVYNACPATSDRQAACNDDAFGLLSAVTFYTEPDAEYWIRVSGFDGAKGAFRLHLGEGGVISGTVRDAATGNPLSGGQVEIFQGREYYSGSVEVDAAGEYTLWNLGAGAYYVSTTGFRGFVDELHSGVHCPGGAARGCNLERGRQVAVRSDGAVKVVDFALDVGGVLSGVVTHAASGEPLPDLEIDTYNSAGTRIATDTTDADGAYVVDGLATAEYFVAAENSGYLPELYDNVACWDSAFSSCSPTDATPVQVVLGATSPGVDFALDELGTISGRVTDATTGEPLQDVQITVFYPDHLSTSGFTDSTGSYRVAGLPAGTYFVRTEAYETYVNEIYDDAVWVWDDVSGATPIQVALNQTVAGIDFALDRLGVLTGTVTDAATGDPISSVELVIRAPTEDWVAWMYTDSSGRYTSDGLAAGSYIVHTDLDGGDEYLDELYEELPCLQRSCDITLGTLVGVRVNETTRGVDFTLDLGGIVSGTLTDPTGAEISSAQVDVWDETGNWVASGYSDSAGHYRVAGLEGGNYFVTTNSYESGEHFFDELYEDQPCESGCEPIAGTPIPVRLGQETSGVDFVLDRLGSIAGTLTDAIGTPISWRDVAVWDATGSFAADTSSDSTGHYRVPGLLPGTYYVTASGGDGFLGELYDGLTCGETCEVAAGTPISVELNQEVAGIDFVLERLGSISGTVTDSSGAPVPDHGIAVWDTAGLHRGDADTDPEGRYQVELPPGTYFVTTQDYGYPNAFWDKLYDDLPCEPDCVATFGTPVAVRLAQETTGIDFVLERLGSISGKVFHEDTRQPVREVEITAWSVEGSYVDTVYTQTDSDGAYSIEGLLPGTYYVSTSSAEWAGYRNEVYSDVPCYADGSGTCDPTKGSPVSVELDSTTAYVDFALRDLASAPRGPGGLEGTVREAGSAKPLRGVLVDIWNVSGARMATVVTDPEGRYDVSLAPSTYFVSTDNQRDLTDEVFDGVRCSGEPAATGGCDPTLGTPVRVRKEVVKGIDFLLQPLKAGLSSSSE